jgi:hypothetical protein
VQITQNPIGGYDCAHVADLAKAPSPTALARLQLMQTVEGGTGVKFAGVFDAILGRPGGQLV